MTKQERSTPSRRTVLSGIGAGLTTSLIGTGATAMQSASQYVLVQDGACVPVQPLRGDSPADAFYDYRLPEQYASDENGAFAGGSVSYASAGTRDLQRAQTSIVFLYQGPEGLSLVVVHGSVENDDAGAVTFEVTGLPEEGEWIVKDDLYRNPDTGELASTNYDRWTVDGTDHRIDWTWGSSGTDGGVFRALGDEFDVTVRPAFNEASPLFGEHYQGTVTDWEFLSGTGNDVERVSLDLEQPIRIATGSCEDVSTGGGTGQQTERQEETKTPRETEQETATEQETKTERETETERETTRETTQETDQQVEQEQNVDVDQEQDIDADEAVETEQRQEVETEQRQEVETKDDETEEDEEEEKEDDVAEKEKAKAKEKEDEGRGKGHEKGRGKGHEKGRGKGHEKHDDDEDEDDEEEDEDD